MSIHRFTSGQIFRWKDGIYQVMRLLPDDEINIEQVRTGAVQIVKTRDLVMALFNGDLTFQSVGASESKSNSASAGPDRIDLSDYPKELVEIARWRLKAIKPLLEKRRRTRADVKQRSKEIKAADPDAKVSVSSLYNWIGLYVKSGRDMRSLIPQHYKRGGRGQSRVDREVNAIIKVVIEDKLFVPEQVTIDQIFYEVCRRINEENKFRVPDKQLNFPSRTTVARRINQVDIHQRLVAKRGIRAANRELTQFGQRKYPDTPLTVVEIDHTLLDLYVIDEKDNLPLGRLTLTHCLDSATRYPLGYYLGFEPPSYLAVMECLYHAMQPKNVTSQYGTAQDEWLAFGIPGELVTDRGKEFKGASLQDACDSLDIRLNIGPPMMPEFKPLVERAFGSANTMFIHGLPGTTFSNPQQRGNYDSQKQACIYLDELEQAWNIFLVDYYAQRPHRGLSGATPASRWKQAVQDGFMPKLPTSAEELRILLGQLTWRTIQHYGIEINGLRYNCRELGPLRHTLKKHGVPEEQLSEMPHKGSRRSAWVKIKSHPSDLSRIWVYDAFNHQYIEVPALAQEYTQGLSLWKHKVIRRVALENEEKADLAALGRAQKRIQDIVSSAKARKKSKGRASIARWEHGGGSSSVTEQDWDGEEEVYGPISDEWAEDFMESLGSPGEGWEIDDALPKSRRGANKGDNGDQEK